LTVPNPLEIPNRLLGLVSTDFITQYRQLRIDFTVLLHGLTNCFDEYTLSLRGPLILLLMLQSHSMEISSIFMDNQMKLYSGRDPNFTWRTKMAPCGFKLETSSVRHPQTECSSVTVHGMLANYIKFYCSFRTDGWAEGKAS
jgi:hypothetical protein